MSDQIRQAIQSAKTNVWEFRMAIFWFILFSINSLATTINASLMGAEWDTLDHQTKFMIVLSIITNWTGTVMAFVSRQAARVKKTGDIFPTDTTFMVKTPDKPAEPTKQP